MHFVQQKFGEVEVLSLKGKLVGGPEVEKLYERIKEMLGGDIKKIVIDLKHVNRLASMGIGALMRCLMTVRNEGGDMKLTGLSEKLKDLFSITKMVGIVNIYDSVNEAVQSFDTPEKKK